MHSMTVRTFCGSRLAVLSAVCMSMLAVQACLAAKLKGIAYSPYSQSEDWCAKTSATIAQELDMVRSVAQSIRLYSMTPCPQHMRQVLAYAQANNMKVLQGLWIQPDALQYFDNELNALREVLPLYANTISAIAVGNEAILMGATTGQVASCIIRVRSLLAELKIGIPITTVDASEMWMWRPEMKTDLVPLVDFIGANIHPYSMGAGAQDASYAVFNRLQEIKNALAPLTPKVVVTEVGWPSEGAKCCDWSPYAVPGYANANLVLQNWVVQSAQAGISEYFYFEAFNADWKRTHVYCPNGCEMEYHWGLWYSNGTAKPDMKYCQLQGNCSKNYRCVYDRTYLTGTTLGPVIKAASASACQMACNNNTMCMGYYWFTNNECQLMSKVTGPTKNKNKLGDTSCTVVP